MATAASVPALGVFPAGTFAFYAELEEPGNNSKAWFGASELIFDTGRGCSGIARLLTLHLVGPGARARSRKSYASEGVASTLAPPTGVLP